jgi:hypothetical protein
MTKYSVFVIPGLTRNPGLYLTQAYTIKYDPGCPIKVGHDSKEMFQIKVASVIPGFDPESRIIFSASLHD